MEQLELSPFPWHLHHLSLEKKISSDLLLFLSIPKNLILGRLLEAEYMRKDV